MQRGPDLLLGLDMRASLDQSGGVISSRWRGRSRAPMSGPNALPVRRCSRRYPIAVKRFIISNSRCLRLRAKFTKLLVNSERDKIVDRAVALGVAGHDQAESLVFHRLAVAL